MDSNLIVVRQLPIIEEQLIHAKVRIQDNAKYALSLAVTEDSLKAIKEIRASLNREFKELEAMRIEAKKAILSPYDKFEVVYKECVSDIFKSTDEKLKARIDEVENELKRRRRVEIERFYNEYAESKGVDFLPFDNAGITIALSGSKKALKDHCRKLIDKIADELKLIDTQEHKAEILVEYKKSLNVAAAITTVVERMKAIEAENARVAASQKAAEKRTAAVQSIDDVIASEQIANPAAAPLTAPVAEPCAPAESADETTGKEKVFEVTFSVTGTLTQLKALKSYLHEGGYNYVSK